VCRPRALGLRFAAILTRWLYIYLFGREPILIFHEKVAHDCKPDKIAMWRTEALCIGMKAN
jgi:hypothetical protein